MNGKLELEKEILKVPTINVQTKKKNERILRKEKVQKGIKYTRQNLRQKKYKGKENKNKKNHESSDCECLICLYSVHICVQCLACKNWAQVDCIKGESTSFVCPDCSADCDYN